MTNLSARSDTESEPPAPRSELVFLSALCLLCFFWRLGSAGLFDFNEGLYAQAAREMVLRGDWVAGSVNGVLFFDKPPLALWLTAISYSTFGFTEFAARLPVALAATGLVFLTYWFGARHFSRKAGVLAGAVLALGPLFLGTARQMTMDIHQSLWFAVAMVSFFEGYRAESAAGKRWYYVFWIGCGLAFMAKSVPGLFPVAACLAFVVIQARFRPRDIAMRVWEAKPLAGLLILVLIIAPWHYAAYQKHGDYFYQEYWVLHHVALLKGTDFDHAQPFWYYFPALFAGMFPWSVFLIPALVFAWKQARSTTIADSESTARRFVLVWSLVVFLVFSAMTSKLVSYLLPMYSAAAVLIGDWLDRVIAGQRNTRGFTISAGLAAALAAIVTVGAAAALYHYTRPGVDVRGDFAPAAGAWIIPAVLAVAVGAAAAAVLS